MNLHVLGGGLRMACLPMLLVCAVGTAEPLDATVHSSQWPAAHWPLPRTPQEARQVNDLLGRMTDAEKVGQLIQADIATITPDDIRKYHLGSVLAGGNSKPKGATRATAGDWQALADAYWRASTDISDGGVGIPLLFGIDAVHGDNSTVGATLFPQNVALGATHDVALMEAIGAATAEEVRATGIGWTFAPTLAVPQDVRWGRAYEGYSEMPALVADYATAMVNGLQGRVGTSVFLDERHAIATAKHFLGDGGTQNGKDQGDTQVSEATLRSIHDAGYPPSVNAGVQTVMASFSSWNGVKMHGNADLLTGVLKGRMNFGGFVVGDWNGHGQVPGCANDHCAAAINAGVDMLMAPDSWKGLYANTLADVASGAISKQRLNEAVSRILLVKVRSGAFSAGLPSEQALARNAAHVVGSPAHRALARRAVRESLVLLKNNQGLLPLDPKKHVLVSGDGADSISRQSGGWTLTWQGVGLKNTDFPGAQSIWSGIKANVQAAGGTATLSEDGRYAAKPDVAIVVFGEDPYAEFQGDIPNLAYRPGDNHDLALLKQFKRDGIPVVAVFLSGRPLWVNRELNASDAFVAAWLPGSEGGGVADVLFRGKGGQVAHDFVGKLSFSWPRTAIAPPRHQGDAGYDPLFPVGFGLKVGDHIQSAVLPEVSGLVGELVQPGLFFNLGKAVAGRVLLEDADARSTEVVAPPAASAGDQLTWAAVDFKAQEDARSITWKDPGAHLVLQSSKSLDLDRETNGDVFLVVTLKAADVSELSIGMGCGKACVGSVDASEVARKAGAWTRLGVPLKCFRAAGANMHAIDKPAVISANKGAQLSISKIALGTDVDAIVACKTW